MTDANDIFASLDTRLQVEQTAERHQAKIILEPLARGFGHTLGNALRRILLSSMPGSAVTAVRIEGVLHEYSVLPGLHEDVLVLLMNLKSLVLNMHTRDRAELRLTKKGPGPVTAADLTLDDDVEVVDPAHHIGTLAEGAQLELTLLVERGTGYRIDAGDDGEEGKEVGWIGLDASFSPISRVSFSVDNVRVQDRTDLDRLEIDITTNGSIEPGAAVSRAATILYNQISPFVDLESNLGGGGRIPEDLNPKLLMPVDDLPDLSQRSANCLRQQGIHFIGDLVLKTEKQLMSSPNLGKKSLNEIIGHLDKLGLTLGMEVQGWPPASLPDLKSRLGE